MRLTVLLLLVGVLGMLTSCRGSTEPEEETRGKNCCGVRCGNCDKKSYTDWGACSHSCGGGTQSRSYIYECRCLGVVCTMKNCGRFDEHQACNEHCMNGGTYMYEEGCQCDHLHHGSCCECPVIPHCDDDHHHCSGGDPPGTCTQCEQYAGEDYWNSAYWLDDNQCKPRCNWVDNWCWPGSCDTSAQYLAHTCNCTDGFTHVTLDDDTTKCELIERPRIETCRLGIEGPNGEAANSTFVSGTTSCNNTGDTYVNFQPRELFLAFDFILLLPVDPPSGEDRHNYVEDFHFGIVEAFVENKYHNQSGGITTLKTLDMAENATCNDDTFSRTNPVSGLISCTMVYQYNGPDVEDGSKLCHHFEPGASGYVQIRNIVNQSVSDKHLYEVTRDSAEKCFHFDFTSASHCKADSPPNCSLDALDIGTRVQRHPYISARFPGYYDPDPGSVATGPSGIDRYIVDIHLMQLAGDHLFVDPKIIESFSTSSEEEQLDFELPAADQPMMYSIILTTLDLAGNYRMARRFVIYDNSSYLAVDTEKHNLRPISANPPTSFTWQASLDPIIVDWQEYFYNVHYKHSNFLLPILENSNMTGVFEQTDEPIPVTGTPNVHGITAFLYQYEHTSPSVNNSVPFQAIPNVLDQQVTLSGLSLNDGDTVEVTVRAVDISNNTIDNSFRLYIDSTPPELMDLGLSKEGERVFVHGSKDLKNKNFTFKAHDPHSSLHQVKWKLGSYPQGDDIASGALPVVKISDTMTCGDTQWCYCPIIGNCSLMLYNIQLNSIFDDGDHNREYYLWIEATNKAFLRSAEVIKILVDDLY